MQKRNIRSLLTDKDDAMLREIEEEYPVPFDQEKLFHRSTRNSRGQRNCRK